jgi:hypothetical protein
MVSEFNPIRAMREEIRGLGEIEAVLCQRENALIAAAEAANVELNAVRKILGFLRILYDAKAAELRKLEQDT